MNLNEYIQWLDEVRINSSNLIHVFIDNKDNHTPNEGIKRLMNQLSVMNNASVICKSILKYQFDGMKELKK